MISDFALLQLHAARHADLIREADHERLIRTARRQRDRPRGNRRLLPSIIRRLALIGKMWRRPRSWQQTTRDRAQPRQMIMRPTTVPNGQLTCPVSVAASEPR